MATGAVPVSATPPPGPAPAGWPPAYEARNERSTRAGYADALIRDVTLTDVDFGTTTTANVIENVENLVLRNVTANGAPVTT
ncbi:hypothetical protein [Nonomuraea fuscirosea]|uniref:hypothetical protein n=1 Tax=Nonomuraea fuscirosea TaxID=1291556 RepID=UPI00342382D5